MLTPCQKDKQQQIWLDVMLSEQPGFHYLSGCEVYSEWRKTGVFYDAHLD